MKKGKDESLEWTLIKKSLTEDLTQEEQEQLNAWLDTLPEHRAFYNRISKFDRTEGIGGLPEEIYRHDLNRYIDKSDKISGKTINDVWYISPATRRYLSCCWVWDCISGTRTVCRR